MLLKGAHLLVVAAIFGFSIALCAGAPRQPPGLALNDLSGVAHQPLDPKGKPASVLFFYWHDCPVCNSYAPEINRICAAYTNCAFYIVQIDPDLTPTEAKKHTTEY